MGSGESWWKKKWKKSTFSPFWWRKRGERGAFWWKWWKFWWKKSTFHPFWWKLETVWWKFCWNLLWEFAERVVGFWREFAEVCQKTGCHPCASPHWTHKQPTSATSIYRASYSLVVMSSCRNVIMPLMILQENAVCVLKEIVYNIYIIYYFFDFSYPFFLNGMMTWWHYGMMAFCIVGKTCQSVVILALIGCDPCANQLWFLR